MSALDDLKVNLSVVLGRNRMPLHMLLRMGRGAIIQLEATESDMVEILANDHPIARGQIIVTGTRITIEVTEILKKAEVVRTPGVTIGDGAIALPCGRGRLTSSERTCSPATDLLNAPPLRTFGLGSDDLRPWRNW